MGSQTVKHPRRATGLCVAAALVAALATTGCSLLTPTRAEVVPEQTLTKLSEPTIATKGVLTVGLDTSDAPLAMQQDGTVLGYLADVARALSHRLGLKVSFVNATGSQSAGDICDVYLGADAGELSDGTSGAGTVFENAPALFGKVSSGGSVLTVQDLANATVGVQMSSATSDALTASGITCERKTFSNINACFDALVAGEVDFVACDATSGAYLCRQYDGVGFVGAIDQASSYCVAVRTTSTELSSAISEAMGGLESDGVLDAIHRAWFGSLPTTLTDQLIDGVTTTAERKTAEEQAAAEQA